MDCLRSFNLRIYQATTFSSPDVKTWFSGSNTHFCIDKLATSTFEIQGFKNVDIYGIELTGYVQTQQAGSANCIVSDYALELFLNGQNPLVSGIVKPTPDYWSLDFNNDTAKIVRLSKFNPSYKFSDPIKSVKNIDFTRLLAVGEALNSPSNASLEWSLNFVFYYKYEGE